MAFLLGGGLCLCDALLVVFVVLKLIGQISWSWWWVTAPFWGQFVLGFAFLIIWAIVLNIAGKIDDVKHLFGRDKNRIN